MDSEDTGGGGTGDTSSYQVLAAGDSYPKKNCQFDEPHLSVPFIPLAGEYAEYVGRTSDGLISLSNYRVFLTQRETTYHVPLGIIETIECREIFFLYLLCKDTKSYKITFGSNEECAEWQRRLGKALALPARLENVFSFAFYMWTMESQPELHQAFLDPDVPQSYPDRTDKMFQDEICRLGFDLGGAWRISLANQEYQLCSTYPRKIVIPASINDNNLESVARFRSARRVPAVVWRHPNGAVIARCSQPEVGWLGWRSSEDEDLVKAIAEACAYDTPQEIAKSSREQILAPPPQHNGDVDAITPASDIPSLCDLPEAKAQTEIKKVLIVDARSYATAVANRARGGGCECPEYYPQCEIQFMNLANIHTIRKSHHALRLLVASSPDIPNWLSLLENTRWLAHIAGLMKAAAVVVQAVANEARPVLVHCSDGWDRTPQITALSQLLMDPYYRTIQGFQVLVEREWVEFGHKFSDRCGCGRACEDINERCPVFLQWLDCVHHLLYAYPTAFQFNQAFLVKLAQHVYSNLFGSFICNSSQERVAAQIGDRTYSVWSLLRLNRHRYINYLYQDTNQVLTSSCHMKDLRLWTSVYMPEMGDVTEDPHTSPNIVVGDEEEDEPAAAAGELVKTKSCDDLLASTGHTPHLQRRSSDPNIRDSCPNMAMLNSALGAELTSEGGATEIRTEEGPHNPMQAKIIPEDHQEEETLNNIHDNSHTYQNSNRNEESDSLTLCETETSLCSDLPTLGEDSVADTEQVNIESPPITNGHLENEDTSPTNQVVHNGLPEENGVGEYVNGYIDQGEEASELLIDSLSSRLSKHGLRDIVGGGRLLREVENEPSIEGSTDTLVAELGIIASEDKEKTNNSDKEKPNETTHLLNGKSGSDSPKSLLNSTKCCPFMNGFSGSEENEICTTNNNKKVLNKKKEQIITAEYISEDKKALNNISNSGIASSCNICIQSKKLLDETSSVADWRGQESTVTHSTVVATNSSSRGTATSVAPASRVSHYSTPAHSRTPSSCIPSTPNEDRLGNGGDGRSNNYATTDGLHNVSDEVTKRLHHIMLQHQAELESVKRDLAATRQALCNQMLHNRCHHHHHHDHNTEDQMSLPESVGSGSGGSVGQESGVSDTSWEALEEGEAARTTLWVPDHAADQCTGCNTQFWMGRRKHHCRSCGKIFCSECSDNNVPIPSEQLFHPVRVCGSCFFTLGTDVLSKPKILAAASN